MDLQAAMEHVIEEHAEQSGKFDKISSVIHIVTMNEIVSEITQSTSWRYMKAGYQRRRRKSPNHRSDLFEQ